MSAPTALHLDAIAMQLAQALDQYDRETEAMIASWPDMDRYHAVSAQVEKIRLYSSGLPDASTQWVELLIAHAELVHILWRMHFGDEAAARAEIGAVRDQHAECIEALRSRCERVIARARQLRGRGGATA
jgi:hypothetical protein